MGDEVSEAASNWIPPKSARSTTVDVLLLFRSSRQGMEEFMGRLCKLAVSALFLSMLRRSLFDRDLV